MSAGHVVRCGQRDWPPEHMHRRLSLRLNWKVTRRPAVSRRHQPLEGAPSVRALRSPRRGSARGTRRRRSRKCWALLGLGAGGGPAAVGSLCKAPRSGWGGAAPASWAPGGAPAVRPWFGCDSGSSSRDVSGICVPSCGLWGRSARCGRRAASRTGCSGNGDPEGRGGPSVRTETRSALPLPLSGAGGPGGGEGGDPLRGARSAQRSFLVAAACPSGSQGRSRGGDGIRSPAGRRALPSEPGARRAVFAPAELGPHRPPPRPQGRPALLSAMLRCGLCRGSTGHTPRRGHQADDRPSRGCGRGRGRCGRRLASPERSGQLWAHTFPRETLSAHPASEPGCVFCFWLPGFGAGPDSRTLGPGGRWLGRAGPRSQDFGDRHGAAGRSRPTRRARHRVPPHQIPSGRSRAPAN